MAEKLYTIPINEVFDASAADAGCGCPFCALFNRLEDTEVDTILGASMMEEDIRMITNAKGFCRTHYDMMLHRRKRLPMMLTLQTHLERLIQGQKQRSPLRAPGTVQQEKLQTVLQSCYVCDRLTNWIEHMLDTAVYLWDTDAEFRKKTEKQPYFCLPHYEAFLTAARRGLSKKRMAEFYDAISVQEIAYLDKLQKDVDWYCKKFDYRYQEEPWYDAKDAPERAVRVLRGDLHRDAGAEYK